MTNFEKAVRNVIEQDNDWDVLELAIVCSLYRKCSGGKYGKCPIYEMCNQKGYAENVIVEWLKEEAKE